MIVCLLDVLRIFNYEVFCFYQRRTYGGRTLAEYRPIRLGYLFLSSVPTSPTPARIFSYLGFTRMRALVKAMAIHSD